MKEPLEESFIVDLTDDEKASEPVFPAPPDNLTSISDARLRANRQNARLSSGARTPAGKEIVSQNSVTHGLTGGKFRVLSSESQSDFDTLLNDLLVSYAPIDPAESELVTSMAHELWLTRRAIARQDCCLEAIDSEGEASNRARADLHLYIRYQTTHERAYQRYAAELRKLQSERRKAELGFASQKAKEADQVRKQELHEARVMAVKANANHRLMENHFVARRLLSLEKMEFKARKAVQDCFEAYEKDSAERKWRAFCRKLDLQEQK